MRSSEKKEEPKIHCQCCDRLLNDYESTRRHGKTLDFLDMCNSCHSSVASDTYLPTVDRKDLRHSMGIDDGVDNDGADVLPYL